MFDDQDESPAGKWLWAWVEENINAPGYHEDKADFENDAKLLIVQANDNGISEADLKDAAGGDLAQFIMDQQNALTDAEVKRLAAEDD